MINRGWHLANKMPKNATLEQRVEWHAAHQANCSCRKPPDDIQELINKRGKQ